MKAYVCSCSNENLTTHDISLQPAEGLTKVLDPLDPPSQNSIQLHNFDQMNAESQRRERYPVPTFGSVRVDAGSAPTWQHCSSSIPYSGLLHVPSRHHHQTQKH